MPSFHCQHPLPKTPPLGVYGIWESWGWPKTMFIIWLCCSRIWKLKMSIWRPGMFPFAFSENLFCSFRCCFVPSISKVHYDNWSFWVIKSWSDSLANWFRSSWELRTTRAIMLSMNTTLWSLCWWRAGKVNGKLQQLLQAVRAGDSGQGPAAHVPLVLHWRENPCGFEEITVVCVSCGSY